MNEPISVSDYLDKLNRKLYSERARILGEVSEFKEYPGKSYLFFSLKDKLDQSTITCIMFKNDYRISGVSMRDGLEVVIEAYPEVWKPTGRMTFKAESVELVGEGALQKAYEELKKKLEIEGLFSPNIKRQIPQFPHRIGVITSKSGAVIHDFLTNLGKFGYEIFFVDSKVEGQEATRDLLSSIETLRNKDLDVLVVMRGGGSLESFLAFNNEILVRAVRNFPAPVLTGIGHDKDLPLASLVSDKNVSTPTAVANLLNQSWNEALGELRLSEQKIFGEFSSWLKSAEFAEEVILRAVYEIESSLKRTKELIYQSGREMLRGFDLLKSRVEDFLKNSASEINHGDPRKKLSQGYSIVRSGGKILRSVKDTQKGDELDILVSDGIIKSQTI